MRSPSRSSWLLSLTAGGAMFGLLRVLWPVFPSAGTLAGFEINLLTELLASLLGSAAIWLWLERRTRSQLRRQLAAQSGELAELRVAYDNLNQVLQRRSGDVAAAQEQLQTASYDRVWAERALLESERRYRAWMDQASDGIFVADQSGTILETNERLHNLLGISKAEMATYSIFTQLFGESTQSLTEFRGELDAGEVTMSTHSLRRPDDAVIYVEVSARAIEGGRILGIIRDITARKNAEAALEERELWYRTVFEVASDAMFLMDGDEFIDCNAATLKMFRCERDQIVGQPPYRFSPSHQADGQESRTKAREYIRRAFHGERQYFEWQHSRYDDTVFDAEVSLNCITLQGKQFLLAMVRDVTERKRLEAHLRESEIRSRTVVEVSRDAIVATDADGNISVFNPAAEEMFGIMAADMIGSHLDRFVGVAKHAHDQEMLRSLFATGRAAGVTDSVSELQIVRTDGVEVPVELGIAVCRDTSSMRVVASFRAIPIRKAEMHRESTPGRVTTVRPL